MDGPHEIVIRVPGDRSWCMERVIEAQERSQTTTFDVLSLPAFRVTGEPAVIEATWTDLDYANAWSALSVAEAALVELVPSVRDLSEVQIEIRPQDPDVERRRPHGT